MIHISRGRWNVEDRRALSGLARELGLDLLMGIQDVLLNAFGDSTLREDRKR